MKLFLFFQLKRIPLIVLGGLGIAGKPPSISSPDRNHWLCSDVHLLAVKVMKRFWLTHICSDNHQFTFQIVFLTEGFLFSCLITRSFQNPPLTR